MSSILDGLLQELEQDASVGKSRLNLRNESKQVKAGSARIPKFKFDKNKKSRLLFLTDLAIPFNPLTGKEDDNYNKNELFRPEWSTATTMKAIKLNYKEHPELLPDFCKRLGVDNWDVSNPDVLTDEDFQLFNRWRKQRVFTHDVVFITSESLNRVAFPCAYRVNYERDPITGDPILKEGEEYPKILQIANFFSRVISEKMNDWKKNNPDASEKEEKQQFSTFSKLSPVSRDVPQNTMLAFEIPLGNDLKPKDDLSSLTPEDLEKCLVVVKRSKSLSKTLSNLQTTYKNRDVYPDFLELDVLIGNEEKISERAQGTKYNNAEFPLKDLEGFDKLNENLDKAIQDFKNQEEKVSSAAARRAVNDTVIDLLCQSISEELPYDQIEEFISEDMAVKYAPIISLIYGDDATEVLTSAALGEGKESTVDEEQSEKNAKNISEIIARDAEEGEEVTDVTI